MDSARVLGLIHDLFGRSSKVPPRGSGYPEPHFGWQRCLRCNYRARHFFTSPVDDEFAEVCVSCYLGGSIPVLLRGLLEGTTRRDAALLLEEACSIL